MSLCFTSCKLLVIGLILMALFTEDVDAWRRRRWRFRVRRFVRRVRIRIRVGVRFAATDCVDDSIISRADWSAGPSSGTPHSIKSFDKVCIYGVGDNTCEDQVACEKLLHVMQDTDRLDGSVDIKPNFLVGQDGQVYEGRGWDVVGEYDSTDPKDQTIGIAFIGDFSDTAPNQASFDAVRAFLSCSKRLSPNPAIDVAEDTPIYDVIKTWASPAKE